MGVKKMICVSSTTPAWFTPGAVYDSESRGVDTCICGSQPMTSKLTSEILDDETLAELIAFRRSRVEYCQKEGLPYQKALHDSMMLALEELQERRKAERDSNPVGWTDEAELRDVEKDGCGYLFKANPITLHADPRRVTLLYRHAQPAPVVPEEKPIPNTLSMYAVDAVAAIAEVKGWNACRAAMLAAAPQEVK